MANGLIEAGAGPDARVAILTGNNDLFFEIWHGAIPARCVLAPVNARLAPPEVAYILNDCGAEVLFVDGPMHELVEGIRGDLPSVHTIISLAGTHGSWPLYSQWRDGQPESAPGAPINGDDTVVQMYTSGTTGFPKGVELSHRSMLACVRSMMGVRAWPEEEIALVSAPLFHTAGCAYAHAALQSGGTIVVLPAPAPGAVLTAIQHHRVTQALLVPAVIQMLLAAPESRDGDFSTLKRVLYGASPIPFSTLRQAVALMGCDFEQGYGLTETVGPIAMLRPEDHDGSDRMKSCGKAVPGTTIRVVDAGGQDCQVGEVGEIICNGAQLMKGYWKRPEDTAATIRDGWLYTGDAGFFDADGYLYIYDRIKDMIVSGGENVYPAEVESAVSGHPAVADVAVIGVPDDTWGEAVKAVVVLHPGKDAAEHEIIDFARQHIAGFKCPKSVDFVADIPRNASGKILKRELREPYWQGRDRRV